MIGRGDIEANREKLDGFAFPFAAVDESGDTAAAFDAVATPTGVIVMPNGTIVDEVAKGRPEIQKLVGRAYLEMWVRVPGRGEFFGRGTDQTVEGTTGWPFLR